MTPHSHEGSPTWGGSPVSPSLRQRWQRLAVALLSLATIWLVILPWISRQPVVARHVAEQERQGIDPSAMFYSELEILPPIAHHVERLHETNWSDFWGR